MAKRKRQTTQWTNEKDRQHNGQTKKTDNTMAKRKRQTTQWPNEKDRQHNGQTKKEKMTNYKALHIKLKTGEIIENVGKSVFFIFFLLK
jgi:hypothetical protein